MSISMSRANAAVLLVPCFVTAPTLGLSQTSLNPQTAAHAVPMTAPEEENLHLVLDWWRQVIEAGHLELVPRYQAESYIQHNPNINTSPKPPAQFNTGNLTATESTTRAIAIDATSHVYMERKLALAGELIASDYIEHDPDLSANPTFQTRLAAYRPPSGLRNSVPVISIVNGEYVLLMWDVESPDPDESMRNYPWNYFQLVRVHGGKVVEHWDQDLWHR